MRTDALIPVAFAVVVIFLAIMFLPDMILGRHLTRDEYAGNLHMHTTCSDGANTYEEMVRESLKLGFSFIAISDHTVCQDIVEKCMKETRLLCIPAQEYVSPEGHVLAINITKALNYEECAGHTDWQCDRGPNILEAIRRAREQGGFVIAAHPFTPAFKISEDDLKLFDAMECDNYQYSKQIAEQCEAFSVKYGKPCVYDSDAHDAANLGKTYDICRIDALGEAGKLDTASVISAINYGNCREYIPWHVQIQRYLSPGYWSLTSQTPLGTSSIN